MFLISNIKKILNLTTTNFKSKILSTNYHLIDLHKPEISTKLDENLLKEDGHPQLSPNERYLITDTGGKIIKNSFDLKSLLKNTNWKKL